MAEHSDSDGNSVNEIECLRRRVAELEAQVAKCGEVDRALRESETRFRQLAECSSEGILLHRQGRFVDANAKLLELYGYSRAELRAMDLFDLAAPEWRDTARARVAAEIEETYEIVGLRKDGTRVPLEVAARCMPLRGEDIRVVGIRDITERKRKEREKNRLIAILETSTDMVATATLQGDILYMNRAGRELIALSDQVDIRSMKIGDFHPPEELRKIIEVGIPTARREVSYSHETQLLRRDGHLIHVSQLIMTHFSPEGEPEYLSTVIRDISAWKRAEAAARESEEKFSSVIQASPMGVHMYELDSDDRLIFIGANPAADRMLGVDNSQFIGMRLEDAFPPMAGTEIPRHYRRAAVENLPWQSEQIDYEDDQIAGAYEVYAFQTSPGRMAVMFLDITNRLRAEEALRESEAKHRSLFENMSNGVVYQDAEGRIASANPAALQILGCSLEELLGRRSVDLRGRAIRENGHAFPASEHPAVVALHSGRYAHAVIGVFNPREEAYRWLDVHATPQFRHDDGRPFRVFTTITDISERKQAEAQRQELEEQLRQAQKMEAIGRLAGGLAHDFNNLLTAIGGYSDLLAEDLEPDHPGRLYLTEIRKAEQRAAALTEQLLAFSRKQMIAPKVVDLNRIIQASRKMLASLIGEDIELEFELQEELGAVKADPNQIDQILINLAANARDAMPEGGTLVVSTQDVDLDRQFCQSHPEVAPGRHVLLHVSDTGSGMDELTRERAFEPFFTTKDAGQGTGLGLATVYGVARQNGGIATVYSAPGVGTTVDIFLPVVLGDIEPEDEVREPSDLAGRETILLVEDESTVRDLTERMLRPRGYTILNSVSAGDALRICQEYAGDIDLVLTDVIMPEMNGKELYGRLIAIRPQLKVLYISGYSADIIADRGVLEETTQFLGKPFTAAELARKVRQALDQL